MFQSAPGPQAKRNKVAGRVRYPQKRFNPLPAHRPRETVAALLEMVARPVSIRSRPTGQEKRGNSPRYLSKKRTFQSAPGPQAKRNRNRWILDS